jgi:hypothetical protein
VRAFVCALLTELSMNQNSEAVATADVKQSFAEKVARGISDPLPVTCARTSSRTASPRG